MARMQRCAPVALVLAVCIVSGSGQGLPQPRMPAFPALPKPGAASAGYQMLAPSSADAAAMAPSEEVQVRQAHRILLIVSAQHQQRPSSSKHMHKLCVCAYQTFLGRPRHAQRLGRS